MICMSAFRFKNNVPGILRYIQPTYTRTSNDPLPTFPLEPHLQHLSPLPSYRHYVHMTTLIQKVSFHIQQFHRLIVCVYIKLPITTTLVKILSTRLFQLFSAILQHWWFSAHPYLYFPPANYTACYLLHRPNLRASSTSVPPFTTCGQITITRFSQLCKTSSYFTLAIFVYSRWLVRLLVDGPSQGSRLRVTIRSFAGKLPRIRLS